MANEIEIRPALAAEEWGELLADESHLRVIRSRVVDESGPNPHGVAALALYRQPFGFTRDDVSAIEDAAHEIVALIEDGSQRDAADRHAAELRAIAAKIAALLPPHP